MYRTNDKQAAIREIKKYLYVISTRVYPEIGRTTIDGQYDAPTQEAVRAFQKIKGLPEHGEVDIDTFNALYDVYDAARWDFYARDYIVEDTDFPVGIGRSGEDVRALHILINELGKHHVDVADTGSGSYYSARTARAVKSLQRAYGLKESGDIDKIMFSRMLTELRAIRSRDKNPRYADLFTERRL